jgi:CRISPR/Cas system CSM-associated protein Csm3 (group 7 of RAMP superfamily)
LGAFSLEDLLSFERDLDDPDQLLAYLENDDPLDGVTGNPNWSTPIIAGIQTVSRPADDGSQHLAGHWAALTIDLQFNGPVISNHAGSALRSGFDAAPLLAADGDWDAPILSGAGLRGVIRSHAERLSRTWTTHQIQAEGPSFLERCPACDPLQSEPGQPLASCDSLLRKAGVLYDQEIAEERLCLACRLFGSTRRGSRLKISDAAFDEKNTVGKPSYKMLDFLAIDRFTGGGQDKLKFDALVLWKPAFTFKIFIEDPQDWELAWLALVLRDMQTQLVAIGSGASKGFGRLENLAVTATLGFLHDADLKGLGLPAEGQREAAVYTTQPFDLFAQDTWLKNWREHAAGLNRDVQTLPPLQTDSYFGTSPSLDVLYPLEVRDER